MTSKELLSIIVVLLVFIVLSWYWLPHLVCDDHIEIARRLECSIRQKHIFSALNKYHAHKQQLPNDLEVLVREGYLNANDLYCPTPMHYREIKNFYKYCPENYMDASKPVVTEDAENHNIKGVRLRRIPPVVNEVMGNGKYVRRFFGEPNSN